MSTHDPKLAKPLRPHQHRQPDPPSPRTRLRGAQANSLASRTRKNAAAVSLPQVTILVADDD